MKPLFESRYDYPSNDETAPTFSSSFTNSQKVLRVNRERWLARNFELIEAVADTGNGLVDLWEASPVRLDSNKPKTGAIIDVLFPRQSAALLWVVASPFRYTCAETLVQAAKPTVYRAKSDGG